MKPKLHLRGVAALPIFLILTGLMTACGDGGETELPFGLQTEVVTNADHASDIVFAPDGRMFFAEQYTGAIRVVSPDGRLQEEPFAQVTVANWLNLDWGLTGLALHPDFQNNHYVYAFYTSVAGAAGSAAGTAAIVSAVPPASGPGGDSAQASPAPLPPGGATFTPTPAPGGETGTPAPTQEAPRGQPLLVRFTDTNGTGLSETVISDDFPITSKDHPGYNGQGNIHFGPDGMLYLSLGDYDDPNQVQDLSTPVGKLLRLNAETGEAPPDNPLVNNPSADPRIYAYGFREPFDFTFSATGEIFGTDNTTVSCEELNLIRPGENYGWPDVGEFPYPDCSAGDQVDAIYHFARDGKEPNEFLAFVEVSGLAFAPGSRYPSLGDSLFACESQISAVENTVTNGVLKRLVVAPNADSVSQSDVIEKDCKGDVEAAPDGTLYYSNATEIRRLLPGDTAATGS